MNVQHTGKYKCVHVQKSLVQRPYLTQLNQPLKSQSKKRIKLQRPRRNQRARQLQSELSAARKSPLKRYCWYLIVCAYYFCALYVNEEIFGLNHKAFDESVYLSTDDWRMYFFNASVIALSCLTFIAFMPRQASRGEKAYSVIYFVSLVLSALSYDDATNMEWWWLDEIDIVMQYWITAALSLLSGWYLCRLLRFCYAYLVSLFYE